MNRILSIGISVTMATVLSFGLVSCGNNNAEESNNNATAQTQEAPVDRVEAGIVANYDTKLSLKDGKEFSSDNYLILADNSKFTITSSGFVDVDQEGKSPSQDEKFHAINYTFTQQDQGYNVDPEDKAKMTLTVNGKTTTPSLTLASEGTLLVSAPEDAEIVVGMQRNGVTQSINMKDAKRVEGIADGWYENNVGMLSAPSITETKQVGDVSANLKLSFNEVTRTPYLDDESLKWAMDGKGTWVVLELEDAKWDVKGADAVGQTAKISLKDATGAEYTAKKTAETFDEPSKLAFAVPTGINEFTIHTENSTDLTSWGDNLGSTGVIATDTVKITFEDKK